jgi:hypothetical protein
MDDALEYRLLHEMEAPSARVFFATSPRELRHMKKLFSKILTCNLDTINNLFVTPLIYRPTTALWDSPGRHFTE